jgi:hypothetical protein
MQSPLINNQAWYEAKWHMLYNQLTEEHVHTAIHNCPSQSAMQDKLDPKDEDHHMVANMILLDYLYHLETEGKQERAKKQRLNDSLEKKGNLKATEAVETGCILKKDKKHKGNASEKDSSKKSKKGKYCDWCHANHDKKHRFVHRHMEADCNFKKAAKKKLAGRKKGTKSRSG